MSKDKTKQKNFPREISFKIYYWTYEDFELETKQKELRIHLSGVDANNNGVHCIVKNFTPYIYLQLPKLPYEKKWENNNRVDNLFEYFKNTFGKHRAPLQCIATMKKQLKYGIDVEVLFLTFNSQSAMKGFCDSIRRSNKRIVYINADAIPLSSFVVQEDDIDPIIKFTSYQKISLAGWVTAKELISEEEINLSENNRKYSTVDTDFYANFDDVIPFAQLSSVIVSPKYLAFDIEANSMNYNTKLPKADEEGNYVFQIGIVLGTFGNKSSRCKILLSLGNPLDIDECEVKRFKKEKHLLLTFVNIINEYAPDTIIGYNHMKFDWDYLLSRAKLCGIIDKFMQMSRIIGRKAVERNLSWSSSAYKTQEFKYPEIIGVTQLDVLVEVERNFRFSTYSLGFVSEYFLKRTKKDVTAKEIFMICKLVREITPKIEKLKIKDDERIPKPIRIKLKKRIQQILILRLCHAEVRELRDKLLLALTKNDFLNLLRYAFWLTGTYCLEDVFLTIDVAEKLNVWTAMEALSNCMCVPMSYLHTRGQRIRVLAQIYNEIKETEFIIPPKNQEQNKEKYEGAIVIEANPGDYDNANVFDFESLYPTSLIAKNICYSTFVDPNDPINDALCNVEEWEVHKYCEHDTNFKGVVNKNSKTYRCKKIRHRFLKVKTFPDGTRENEGIMPKLERKLLGNRKIAKKDLAKAKAKLAMANGEATQTEIDEFKKYGYEIIEKGSLSSSQIEILKVCILVLDAQQNAYKLSANSAYGYLAPSGFVEGAETVTYTGRLMITEAIRFIKQMYSDAFVVYGDTDSGMIKFGNRDTFESFKIGDIVCKQTTHHLKCYLLREPTSEKIICPKNNLEYTLDKYPRDQINILPEEDKLKMYAYDEKQRNFSIICPETNISYTLDKYPRDKMNGLSDENKIKIHQYDGIPINLQFENHYKRLLLLTKKRYIAYVVNRKDEIIMINKKGVVSTRRDNSQYLKDGYIDTVSDIIKNRTKSEIHNSLCDLIHKLFVRHCQPLPPKKILDNKSICCECKEIATTIICNTFFCNKHKSSSKANELERFAFYYLPDTKFIIYLGINDVMSYAKKKTGTKLFIGKDKKILEPQPTLYDDPRLDYPNLPQVILARKMLDRGEKIMPNTRLEFVYLEKKENISNHGSDKGKQPKKKVEIKKEKIVNHQGEKAEDFDYYRDNRLKENLKIDYLHYIEKQLQKPITELLEVKFKNSIVPFINLENEIKKEYEKIEYHKIKINKTNVFEKEISLDTKLNQEIVGWKLICRKCIKSNKLNGCELHNHPNRKPKKYKYSKFDAKVEYILESMNKRKKDPSLKLEISSEKYNELLNMCLKWKSINIIKKLCAKHGVKAPKLKKPTQTCPKLRLSKKGKNGDIIPTKVVLSDDYRNYKKGEIAELLELKDLTPKVKTPKSKKIIYKIRVLSDNKVLEDVPREMITTFRYKDATMILDIYKYRLAYKQVINHLNKKFLGEDKSSNESEDENSTSNDEDDSDD